MLESCCDAFNSSLYTSTVIWACRPAGRLSGGAGRPCSGQAAASRDAAEQVALALAHVDERAPGHAPGRGCALRVALRLPSPSCQLCIACIDSTWGMQNSSATESPSLQLLAENRRCPVGSVSWKKYGPVRHILIQSLSTSIGDFDSPKPMAIDAEICAYSFTCRNGGIDV